MTSSAQSPISQDHQPVPDKGATPPSAGDRAPSPSMADLPSNWQYEAAVAEVETIIAQIEAGNLELADIFEQFGLAVQHLHECEVFLNHHRQQVDILVETLTDEEDR